MAVMVLFPVCVLLTVFVPIVHRIVSYLRDSNKLRRYPALSPVCGITNLGYILELWRSDKFRTRALAQAHRQHGIIRLGPNALSFSDTGAIRDIYGHSTTCVKGDMYSAPAGPHRSLLDCVDKQEHAEKRRRLAAAFATKHLEAWEHKVVDKCSRLLTQFDRHCNSSDEMKGDLEDHMIDFRKWSNLFTIEAIADIAMSEHLGLLEAGNDIVTALDGEGNSRRVYFIHSLHGIGRTAAPFVWSSSGYRILKRLCSLISTRYANEVTHNVNFDGLVRQLTVSRLQRYRSGEKIDDFFTSLVENKRGEPTGLSLGELTAEVGVFMNAGSDTTAIALTHALYYLLKNPEKLRKLRKDLDDHLGANEIIPAYAAVKNINYLRACLDESLRLSPPVSFGLERKTPPEGTLINGEWIAGNTLVSVPAYLAHRDPSVFPDPEKYIPERWLTAESRSVQKYFIPFSAGARGCIGRNISYIEQHVLLATLLRRYDFALPYPEWELEWEERFNLWPCAMPLKISRRSDLVAN